MERRQTTVDKVGGVLPPEPTRALTAIQFSRGPWQDIQVSGLTVVVVVAYASSPRSCHRRVIVSSLPRRRRRRRCVVVGIVVARLSPLPLPAMLQRLSVGAGSGSCRQFGVIAGGYLRP
eukprot:5689495-Pyramimonas_sp.AAC.1